MKNKTYKLNIGGGGQRDLEKAIANSLKDMKKGNKEELKCDMLIYISFSEYDAF